MEAQLFDWASIPVRDVPLDRLVWPCHDIDPAHLHPGPGMTVRSGPIYVQALIGGSLYVHDGRHRAIRALLAGQSTIRAHVYEGA